MVIEAYLQHHQVGAQRQNFVLEKGHFLPGIPPRERGVDDFHGAGVLFGGIHVVLQQAGIGPSFHSGTGQR